MPPLRKKKEDVIRESDSGLNETGHNLARQRRLTAPLLSVPVTDIRPSPKNARNLSFTLDQLKSPELIENATERKEAEYIRDLSLTMRDHGQLQPGLGCRVQGGMVELMAGERRWLACQLAGIEEMEVMVYPERPDSNAAQHLIENIHRRDLTPAGVFRGLLNIMDEREAAGHPITSGSELRDVVRMPQTVAYRWWAVIQGASDLHEAVLSEVIPSVVVAERLSRMDDAERDRRIKRREFDDLRESRKNKDNNESRAKSSNPESATVVQPSEKRRPGRPAAHVNMGRCKNPHVVRYIVETLDPDGEYDHVDWDNKSLVGEVWRELLIRLEQKHG